MLKPFAQEVWTADGPDVAIVGFHYPTRMAVIRLSGGRLFIWSPIKLTDALRTEVDAIGHVRHIIAPNSLHHLFLAEWKRAYPDSRLYAPPGLRRKRRDIVFDADLGDAPNPDWARAIDQVLMRGNLITTEVVFFHAGSGTVLFTDLLQQLPEIEPIDDLVDDDPHRAALVMHAHEDHAVREAWIGHRRHRDQELAGQAVAVGRIGLPIVALPNLPACFRLGEQRLSGRIALEQGFGRYARALGPALAVGTMRAQQSLEFLNRHRRSSASSTIAMRRGRSPDRA